jgi:hypothetical protein
LAAIWRRDLKATRNKAMSVFDVEIRRRNARLRAWAAAGVLVEGQWVRLGKAIVVHVACTHCRTGQSQRFIGAPPGMAVLEKQMISKISTLGCTHLQQLLGNDPEEISARTSFELHRNNS